VEKGIKGFRGEKELFFGAALFILLSFIAAACVNINSRDSEPQRPSTVLILRHRLWISTGKELFRLRGVFYRCVLFLSWEIVVARFSW